jgi:hypothetical protein
MRNQEHPWIVDAILIITIIAIFIFALASCKPSPTPHTPTRYGVELPDADTCPTFSLDAGVPTPCGSFHVGDLRPCAECSSVQACVWARAMVWGVRGSCATDISCVVLPRDGQ